MRINGSLSAMDIVIIIDIVLGCFVVWLFWNKFGGMIKEEIRKKRNRRKRRR